MLELERHSLEKEQQLLLVDLIVWETNGLESTTTLFLALQYHLSEL